MNMKCAISKILTVFAVLMVYALPVKAQDTIVVAKDSILLIDDNDSSANTKYVNVKYLKRLERFENAWLSLIPAYSKLQVAGNMGAVSLGIGWQYGKNEQWETDVFLGFIPTHYSKKAKVTFTLKENFTPWKVWENKRFYFEPLSCGIYLNTVFSDEFWSKAPDKYPNGYYWFSTKIRTNIFIGQRLTLKIPQGRRFFENRFTFFYEISTHDFAIIQAVKNSYLTPKDYLTLSFGIKASWK